MNNLILLAACFFLGVFLSRSGRMPQTVPAALNSFIIHVSLPALTLLHLHGLRLSQELFLVAAMPWIIFLVAVLFFLVVGWSLKLPRETIGALILLGGLGNTSFLGLPMIEVFFGQEGLAYGIIVDQLGSFLVLSIFGITIAAVFSGGSASATEIYKRIIFFPPFISLLIAVLLIPVPYPSWFVVLLKRLGDTLVPLALFSVGFQFHPGHIGLNKRSLLLGLGFKLILAPFFIWVFYLHVLGARGLPIQVTLFEAAMPPMISAGIIAAEYKLNPPLANLMIALGLVISFFTLTVWSLVIRLG